jgi:hypothetical protein
MMRLRVAVTADVVQLPRSMDHVAAKIVLGMLGILGIGQCLAGCGSEPEIASMPIVEFRGFEAASVAVKLVPKRAEPVEPAGWRPGPLDLPDTCDRLTGRVVDGEPRLGKVLPSWLGSETERWREQRRMRALVRLVGDELGLGPEESEMLWRIAIREGSGNAGSVHVHAPDVEANESSAHRMDDIAGRWREAPTTVYDPSGETSLGTVNGWAIGRGMYGMNTSLFMPRWSLDAPPWALCDPIVATVVAVWSMRASQGRCSDKSRRSVHRRSWAATCEPRSDEREAQFDRLARGRVRGLDLDWAFDPDTRAELGQQWPEESTDRAELYALLRARAVDQGLVAR